ncbi:MAG: hypothetical protein V1859_01555 [archaeon]
MDEKTVNVNCDFCGKEIECPISMMEKSKKHMCHECFLERPKNGSDEELKDVHVDFPTEDFIEEAANMMVGKMVDETFPSLWSERKNQLKELSKKELAQEMFGAGAYLALSTFMKLQHEEEKKEADKKEVS